MPAVLRLVRVGNTVVSFVGTVVGGVAAAGHGIELPASTGLTILLAAASTACVTAGGNVLNDLGDRESDRTNHPDRPLVTGAVNVRGARALCAALLVASGLLVLPVLWSAPGLLPILAAALLALFGYELRWKARGIPGNLLVAFLTGAVFLYGGAAGGAFWVVVPLAAMAFFATFSREVIKDMEDAAGDVDRATYPRTHGMTASARLARGAVGAAIVLSPIPLLLTVPLFSVAGIIYLALVVATDGLFLVSVAWLPGRLHHEQSVSKIAMTVALGAFVALGFR